MGPGRHKRHRPEEIESRGNDRGYAAADFAKGRSLPSFLMQGLEGHRAA